MFWFTQELAHERRHELMRRAEGFRMAASSGEEAPRTLRRALGFRLVGAGMRLIGTTQTQQEATDCL